MKWDSFSDMTVFRFFEREILIVANKSYTSSAKKVIYSVMKQNFNFLSKPVFNTH